jgi:hypothetical protein
MSADIIGRIILLSSFLKVVLFVLAAGFTGLKDINVLRKKLALMFEEHIQHEWVDRNLS